MNCTLRRNQYGLYGVFGQLLNDKDMFFAVTLEKSILNKGSYQAVIPLGIYTCIRRLSPHFGYDLFTLENVPGHNFIEIHCGNTVKDTEGCILLGSSIGAGSILDSKYAFEKFMQIQTGVDRFQLTVC